MWKHSHPHFVFTLSPINTKTIALLIVILPFKFHNRWLKTAVFKNLFSLTLDDSVFSVKHDVVVCWHLIPNRTTHPQSLLSILFNGVLETVSSISWKVLSRINSLGDLPPPKRKYQFSSYACNFSWKMTFFDINW